MYLTKFMLNAGECARFRIRDAYAIHKLVYSLFPLNQDSDKPRILYADKESDQGGRFILILSPDLPQGPESLAMTTLRIGDTFFSAGRYHFEVVLNPVRKDSASGKRQAIKGMLPVLQWMMQRSPQWGFTPDEQTLQAFIQNTLTFEKVGKTLCFNRVLFRGTLTVTDQNLFRTAVENGLGHGKGFGFGLLQLSPVE